MNYCFYMYCFLIFQLRALQTQSVQLDYHAAVYVRQLVDKFKENPMSTLFDNVIRPPRTGEHGAEIFYPKIFIWSPIDHFGISIKCPVHDCTLQTSFFTDSSETGPRCPRLVYDLRGNVLLIQRMYICSRHKQRSHRYLSASAAILASTQHPYGYEFFPMVLFHRSGCTKELIDFLETQLLQGVSFLTICDGIAALNYREYCERLALCSQGTGLPAHAKESDINFLNNMFYSFPSNDHLMQIFLADFQTKRAAYENNMTNLISRSHTITCDHTFKVSKFIGSSRRSDQTFVQQFKQLFVVLNERREIIGWQLTRTTAFEEIRDLVANIGRIVEGRGITRVIVDDCCRVKNMYRSAIPGSKVLLDLYHGVQRVTSSVPKRMAFSKKFSQEFGQVFRADGDLGKERTLPTPTPEIIESNLNAFLNRWNTIMDQNNLTESRSEIEKLRIHIKQGCLSGLLPGEGTEGNERLHKIINRTFLTGAVTISPEMVIAILTLIFHGRNWKRKGEKHIGNARITPVMPVSRFEPAQEESMRTSHIKCDNAEQSLDSTWKGKKLDESAINTIPNEITVIENVEEMCTPSISSLLLKNTLSLHHFLQAIKDECQDRSFDVFEIPIMQISSIKNILITTEAESSNETTTQSNQLKRNLSAFNLKVDPVIGDGDCAFVSIVSQLRKTKEWQEGDATLMNHLNGLGLGLPTVDEEAFQLRQLFVNTVESSNYYQMLIGFPYDNINDEVERFRDHGTFSGEVGDLIVKVCSDVLRIPILVITSLSGCPYVPFVPDDTVLQRTLFIAYTASGPGHYDSTASKNDVSDEGKCVTRNKCSCGKNVLRTSQTSCLKGNKKHSRCPCVTQETFCTRSCTCKGCHNQPKQLDEITKNIKGVVSNTNISCRCGTGEARRKSSSYVACSDIRRKSKCPCLSNNKQCTPYCSCVNCANIHGKRNERKTTYVAQPAQKRQRTNLNSYKRKHSADFLSAKGTQLLNGPWSTYEKCLLYCVISLMSASVVSPTVENIATVYNNVATSSCCSSANLAVRPKSISSISSKLRYLEEKQNLFVNLAT